MAGVYVHIPFCKSFCTYCDFYSVCDEKRIGLWLGSLFREMDVRKDFFSTCGNVIPSTLYIGGGTPSRLTPVQISGISAKAELLFRNGQPFEEFTVEVNPDDVTSDYASGLRDAGVTRVSMGIQSFDDSALRWMNRRHTAAGASEAYRTLRDAGFHNISMDLIFGYLVPGESENDGMRRWKADLRKMIAASPEHISAYQMSIEPESTLGRLAAEGKYREPSDMFCASQYEFLQSTLAMAGYEQYEISNFALAHDGEMSHFRSRHNSSYWTRETYIGLGPAAHSFCGNVRSWNPSDLDGYIAAGGIPSPETENLSDEEVWEEKIMLGLRRAEGVAEDDLAGICSEKVELMLSSGQLVRMGDRVRIPAEKWFISDSIITEIIKLYGK